MRRFGIRILYIHRAVLLWIAGASGRFVAIEPVLGSQVCDVTASEGGSYPLRQDLYAPGRWINRVKKMPSAHPRNAIFRS